MSPFVPAPGTPGGAGRAAGTAYLNVLPGANLDSPRASIVPGAVISVAKMPGAMPLTRTPSGRSSCASDAVACPIADLEKRYGKEEPPVLGS